MKLVKNIVFVFATVLMIITIVFVALPMFGRIEYRTIVSPSMEPDIPVGSLIMIKPIKDEDIKIGDVITYAATGETTVTHQVIGYDLSQDALIMHGIANDEGVNEIIPFKKVVGKVVLTIPLIGRPFLWISSLRGKIIAGTAIAFLYVLSVFLEVLGTKSTQEDSLDEKEKTIKTKVEDLTTAEMTADEKTQKADITNLGSWLDDMF